MKTKEINIINMGTLGTLKGMSEKGFLEEVISEFCRLST